MRMKTKLFNDKSLMKNWKPISWLTTDLTNFSKALRKNLKSAFSSLTAWQHTAYVQNRYNDEGGRSASYVTDISEKWTRDDNLVTVDIEEAFNYLHQIFLLVIIL